MLTFKNYLVESPQASDAVRSALDTAAKFVDPHRLVFVTKAFEPVIEALDGGELWNAELTAAKDSLSYVQRVYERLHADNTKTGNWGYYKSDLAVLVGEDLFWELATSHIDGSNAKKLLRSLEAGIAKVEAASIPKKAELVAKFKELQTLLGVFIELTNALRFLKPKVKMGRKPAAPDPNAFVSKHGSAESVELVVSHLKRNIDPELDSFEKQMATWYLSLLARIDQLQPITPSKDVPFQLMFIINSTHEVKMEGWGVDRKMHIIKRLPNAESAMRSRAKSDRMQIEKAFLAKNSLKLSALLDKKGDLEDVIDLPGHPVRMHNGAGTLMTSMRFKFKNGAKFDVRNKVIINQTAAGKQFYQYPTTFHDVVISDGKALATPSEEKMQKDFK